MQQGASQGFEPRWPAAFPSTLPPPGCPPTDIGQAYLLWALVQHATQPIAAASGGALGGGRKPVSMFGHGFRPLDEASVSVSISGLHFKHKLTTVDLKKIFEQYGDLDRIRISDDGLTALVSFKCSADALVAKCDLNGKTLLGLDGTLHVESPAGLQGEPKGSNCKLQLLKQLSALDSGVESDDMVLKRVEQVLSEKTRIESSESSDSLPICIICNDAARSVVFEPCRHLACCGNCGGADSARLLRQCPICRTDIIRRLEVFIS
jgi:hypothetical protein